MTISIITEMLEQIAPLSLQEEYDNAGLITGNKRWECTGAIIALDVTEDVIKEAIEKKCNLVIAHHPIVFRGLKKITGNSYVEKTIICAIKNDIAIYAIHTNLDNIMEGVNGKIAGKLGLSNRRILQPKKGLLQKLVVFVPFNHKAKVQDAMFSAGAGNIGNYSECSFEAAGTGTYKAGDNARPYIGKVGERHREDETRLEVVFPAWIGSKIIKVMLDVHPYEEVAYDLYDLANHYAQTGSGILGELEIPMEESAFLKLLKLEFNIPTIRHSGFTGKMIKKVALCGGAGSFLIGIAKSSGADVFITSDVKYHEFFEPEGQVLLADIGHYESEQFTIDLLFDLLSKKFLNFAVLKTSVYTNPVNYF